MCGAFDQVAMCTFDIFSPVNSPVNSSHLQTQVLLSGYLIKSTERHNADAVSSTIAAFGRLLAYRSKLEQLTVTNESSEESEDMKVIEQVAVVR